VIHARAIAYRVPAGHRLRVEIQNHDAAYVVPEYGPWRCRLYCEQGRASLVVLPVLGKFVEERLKSGEATPKKPD
jgi:predicted acyl esterase